MGRHTGLGGGQVLENESGWRRMPGCLYGAKFPNVDPQSGREIGDVGALGGENNSPGNLWENRTLGRMRRLSSPSMRCESPTGPTEELRPNVHRHAHEGGLQLTV